MNIIDKIKDTLFKLGNKENIKTVIGTDGIAAPPKTIFLAINSVCNLKCKMCDVGQKNKDSQFYKVMIHDGKVELSLDRLKRLVDEVKDFKPFFAITSTEPLLYKDIIKVSQYILENGMQLQLTTNGLLLDKYAGELVDIGLPSLWVSLDGPAEIHDEIRGVSGSFKKAFDGIKKVNGLKKRLNKKLPTVSLNYSITNHNFHCLVDFMDSIAGLDIESISFSHMNYVTEDMADRHNALYGHICKSTTSSVVSATPLEVDVDILYEQIKILKKGKHGPAIGFAPDLDLKGLSVFYKEPEKFVKGTKCNVLWSTAQIMANGDLIPTTRCFDLSLGNINDSSFSEVWNGDKMKDFRKVLLEHGAFPACTRCCGIL